MNTMEKGEMDTIEPQTLPIYSNNLSPSRGFKVEKDLDEMISEHSSLTPDVSKDMNIFNQKQKDLDFMLEEQKEEFKQPETKRSPGDSNTSIAS